MRFSCTYLAAVGLAAASLPLVIPGTSFAQTIENNLEVRVNPQVARPGRALLYPGGEFGRNQPELLYPGERSGPISLHMPGPRAARRTIARAEPSSAPAPAPERAPAPPPAPKRVASAAPPPKLAPKPAPAPKSAPAPAPQAGPSSIFNGPDYSNVFGNAPPQPPQQAQRQTPERQASLAPPPARTAPAGPTNGNETLIKKSMILFAKDATDPAAGALGSIKFLAGELNAAMTSPNARVELQAFGGTKGDKGSDARRLSLKRALAIRQVLIDDGVSPDRIDVRAMGGVDDTGPTDRVDVYTKA